MPASKAQRAATADRRAKATALRIAGMDWQSIADQLGYSSRGAACTDVSRALEANLAELRDKAEEMRSIESMRLDRLQASLWPKAVKGDVKAIDAVLRIIDRRMRLLGLHQIPSTPGLEAARSMLGSLAEGLTRLAGIEDGEDDTGEG